MGRSFVVNSLLKLDYLAVNARPQEHTFPPQQRTSTLRFLITCSLEGTLLFFFSTLEAHACAVFFFFFLHCCLYDKTSWGPCGVFGRSTSSGHWKKLPRHYIVSLDPSIHFQYPRLPKLRVKGSAGAPPSCQRVKVGRQPGQVAISWQGPKETSNYSDALTHLQTIQSYQLISHAWFWTVGGRTVKVPGRELKPQPSCFEVAALTTAPPCCHVEMIDSNFLYRHSMSIFHYPQSCDPINTAPRPSFGVMKQNIGSCRLLATCWGCAASGAEVVEGSITASCKNQRLDVCVHIKAVIVCVRCVLVTMVLVLKHKSLFAVKPQTVELNSLETGVAIAQRGVQWNCWVKQCLHSQVTSHLWSHFTNQWGVQYSTSLNYNRITIKC